MCGICGQISLTNALDPSSDIVNSMMNKMIHRGPDSSGIFSCSNACIGMRRLSLVDLSGGDQPIFNEDKTMVIVMNGEIYNFRKLRTQLTEKHSFLTTSDTEVVLHLFEEYGTEAFNLIEGMYAIAILHIPSGSIWIARDPFGIKPLYWTTNGDMVSFSSELTSLCADSSIPRVISGQALGEYFTFGYVRGTQSIFRGIHRLSPGHYLKINEGAVEEISFYPFSSLLQPSPNRTEPEAFAELEGLLSEIVPSYQAADVPVAAFLSGGIDSSLICKYMKGRDPSTYSMAFTDSSFHDESPYAAEVARILGTKHRSITTDYPDIDTILNILSYYGEPFADSSAIPTFLVSREISRDVKAALSGDGADEVFMGYTLYQGTAVARSLHYLPFKNVLSRSLRFVSGSGGNRSEKLDTIARRLEHAQKPVTKQILDKQSMFSAELLTQSRCLSNSSNTTINNGSFYAKHLEILGHDSVSMLKRISFMQLTLNLPAGILTKVDRAAMANSLEVRIPFLDRRLISFAFNLPDSLKLRKLQTKYILRKLASKYYPSNISKRPKHGFTVPLLDWFAGPLGDHLKKQMTDSAAGDADLVNPKGIIAAIEAHQSGTVNASSTLYSMLVLEQWARKWL
ncbi:MAG: asparagine synthase (glutamine-hydrolyzing) [Candidatus Sabulitectum sp.]|nr:asparagine synthase (glutamine-hydrolyzing) [Candidatus Sabulitectum sp.]